jgi:hypothetical protein
MYVKNHISLLISTLCPMFNAKCLHHIAYPYRQLIQDFFNSAKDFIPPGGQIHMALISHQGGMNATNMIEWKRSWMAGRLSGESDLLLTDILPFEVRVQ